jgi:hypothetical protein
MCIKCNIFFSQYFSILYFTAENLNLTKETITSYELKCPILKQDHIDNVTVDTNDIHPDDPLNPVPKNQTDFKQRVIKGAYQPEFTSYPRSVYGSRHRSFQKS